MEPPAADDQQAGPSTAGPDDTAISSLPLSDSHEIIRPLSWASTYYSAPSGPCSGRAEQQDHRGSAHEKAVGTLLRTGVVNSTEGEILESPQWRATGTPGGGGGDRPMMLTERPPQDGSPPQQRRQRRPLHLDRIRSLGSLVPDGASGNMTLGCGSIPFSRCSAPGKGICAESSPSHCHGAMLRGQLSILGGGGGGGRDGGGGGGAIRSEIRWKPIADLSVTTTTTSTLTAAAHLDVSQETSLLSITYSIGDAVLSPQEIGVLLRSKAAAGEAFAGGRGNPSDDSSLLGLNVLLDDSFCCSDQLPDLAEDVLLALGGVAPWTQHGEWLDDESTIGGSGDKADVVARSDKKYADLTIG